MRRILLGCVSLIALAALGCGDDEPAKVYGDMQWAVRCTECGMCSGIRDRSILGLDGEMSQEISCNVTSSGDQRVFTIRATNRADPEDVFGITIRGLAVSSMGGPPQGSTCVVTVNEGGNRYTGPCGAVTATNEVQPCYLAPVAISDTAAGPEVNFTMMCTDLPHEADANLRRELTSPGSAMQPGLFRITSCAGL